MGQSSYKTSANRGNPSLNKNEGIREPSDISISNLHEHDTIGELKRKFSSIILSAIAGKLAENQKGLQLGDQAVVYDEAVRAGHQSPSSIGKIARSLSIIARPLIKADLTTLLPELNPSTRVELGRAISHRIAERRFHLFIDDTDQVANPDKAGHLNRIWALMLAVRELATDISDLRVVVTLREEVWERLKREASGQRDQTDHFTNLVIHLSSSDEHVRNIVETRLRLAAANCAAGDDIYSPFFEGLTARAPLSEDRRSWPDLFRSRQRPRDAIQLISSLADYAMHNNHLSKIDEHVFQKVMPIFSENRALLFGQEFELECPRAEDILRTLSEVHYEQNGFRMTAEQARDHFRTVSSRFGIVLYGRTIRPEAENDVFDIWRFFYMANVLNARVSDSNEREGYRHLRSEDDPFLVTKSRWNEMQKMLWEVNPAFRDFLVMRQKEQQAMTGLPVRHRVKKDRRPRRK